MISLGKTEPLCSVPRDIPWFPAKAAYVRPLPHPPTLPHPFSAPPVKWPSSQWPLPPFTSEGTHTLGTERPLSFMLAVDSDSTTLTHFLSVSEDPSALHVAV